MRGIFTARSGNIFCKVYYGCICVYLVGGILDEKNKKQEDCKRDYGGGNGIFNGAISIMRAWRTSGKAAITIMLKYRIGQKFTSSVRL